MDSMFLNLTRGSRLSSYMGLVLPDSNPPKFGPNYQYVEIGLAGFRSGDGELLEEAKPNQHLEVVPNCTINVRGSYAVMVHYNPALQLVASVGSNHIIWPGSGMVVPSYYATFRKGIKGSEVEWAVRLSLLA